MKNIRTRHVDSWRMLLPVAPFAIALQMVAIAAAGPAGKFPDFIPMTSATRGVAVDPAGNVFVSVGQGSGASERILIYKFTPDGGGPSFVADIGQGTIGGLNVTPAGDLYVAMAAGLDRGVWRLDPDGQIELLPGSDKIFFANGLAFDDRGTLYVTESVSLLSVTPQGKPSGPGSIWRIPRRGQARLWMRDEVLRGTGAMNQPVWIGANGIAYRHHHLYVTNTEKSTVMRIPIQKDGTAGLPVVWNLQPVPESPLSFPLRGDGIALDARGNLYVAVLTKSAVVRINPHNMSQKTIAAFQSTAASVPNAPLDFPASLCFGLSRGERMNLFVSNLGMGKVLVPQLPWAGPGLVKIAVDAPGGHRR